MYRHTADFIIETNNKMFISEEERLKFHSYEDIMRTKEESYTKLETDEKIKEISDMKYIEVTGEFISEDNTLEAPITDIEIFGNTTQRSENISIIANTVSGAIGADTGEDYDNSDRSRTDFIEVKPHDYIVFYVDGKPKNINVFYYNSDKEFIRRDGGSDGQSSIPNTTVPSMAKYIKLYYTVTPTIELQITRTYLEDIISVGELQEDGKYKLSLKSCGKNLFNINELQVRPDTRIENNSVIMENPANIFGSGCSIRKKCNLSLDVTYTLTSVVGNYQCYVELIFFDNCSNQLGIQRSYGNVCIFTVPKDTVEIEYVVCNGNYTGDTVTVTDIQLEVSTQATKYEQYTSNMCDIILPCQLEKVGDVSDRLYYDNEEKAWCVEKNVLREKFIPTKIECNFGDDNVGLARLLYFNNKFKWVPWHSGDVIANKPKIITGKTWEVAENIGKFSELTSSTALDVIIPSSVTTLDGAKEYTKDHEYIGILLNPKKIILPLSTQIKLNSFFGITHIFADTTKIKPSIKCKITKSLTGSIQTLNKESDMLIGRLANIEGLKESQNIQYETDKGYIICNETNVGFVDDIKLIGNTLVNLVKKPSLTEHSATTDNVVSIVGFEFNNKYNIKPNTTYTLLCKFNLKSISINANLYLETFYIDSTSNNHWTTKLLSDNNVGEKTIKFTIKTGDTVNRIQSMHLGLKSFNGTVVSTEISLIDVIMVEGDYTINTPSHFEGLSSSKLELIVSRNKNLFTGWNVGNIHGNGSENDDINSCKTDFIKAIPNTYYTCSNNNIPRNTHFIFYDKNKTVIGATDKGEPPYTCITPYNCEYVRLTGAISDRDKFQLEMGDTVTEYIEPKFSEKKILYYDVDGNLQQVNELRSTSDTVRDSIEKHDNGKWYYHKRCNEITLDGTESWELHQITDAVNTIRFSLLLNPRVKNISTVLSDKFPFKYSDEDFEHIKIGTGDNRLFVYIDNSRLNTPGVVGFKQWLQTNIVTIVYELDKEEVYECIPLHLDSFEGHTQISCITGSIIPKLEFSVSSHIGNFTRVLNDKLNALEEKMIKDIQLKNRILLRSTYTTDRSEFTVDILSTCNSDQTTELDYGLFDLTKDVISNGVNNYNRIHMEELIDFYTIIGKFSFEMCDELFILMDSQITDNIIEIPYYDIDLETVI